MLLNELMSLIQLNLKLSDLQVFKKLASDLASLKYLFGSTLKS